MIYAMTMSHNAPVRLLSTSTRETVTKIEVNLFNLIFDEISRMKKGSFKKKGSSANLSYEPKERTSVWVGVGKKQCLGAENELHRII